MELAVEKRIHRVMQILLHIESGPRFNARILGEMFGVGRRTIYRDIAILRNVGFVITFDDSADAYRLTTPKPPACNFEFTADDLEMVAVAARLASPALSPKQSHRVETALARLLAGFPVETRIEINQLLSSVHPVEQNAPKVNDAIWKLMVHAIRHRLQVRITIRSGGQLIQTKLSPYRLLATTDGWNIVGRSSLHRASKTFRLESIAEGEVTEESFVPPRGSHRKSMAE